MTPDETTRHMRRALELAGRGWGRVAPNPMVGAVVVREGVVVGEGWHNEYGGPHAEVQALRAAGEAARGATVLVSLEPCSHWGKTPPCTRALLDAGVAEVIYAAPDPNPGAAGGAGVLGGAGVRVTGRILEREALDLNAAFQHLHTEPSRPFIALKLALSLDGRIADANGDSVWITGEESRAEVHRLRAGFDAIAVGIGTALADDPALTVRGSVLPRRPPVRVVFDRALRLPLASALVRTASEVPVMLVAGLDADPLREYALAGAGVRVLRAGGLREGLRALREAGIGSMFVEGGAALAGAMLNAAVVDRMYLFHAPVLLGRGGVHGLGEVAGSAISAAPRWRRISTSTFGEDTLLTLAAR